MDPTKWALSSKQVLSWICQMLPICAPVLLTFLHINITADDITSISLFGTNIIDAVMVILSAGLGLWAIADRWLAGGLSGLHLFGNK